ncbi:MAG: zf-HC2 domain-containing protein [Planctomycetes bacterium]|nr:zf-HC2 domain-containing protein [Planctomycetota bacterium]
MACEDMGLFLSKLVDGELSPSERTRVEDHLARCNGCRGELEVLYKNDHLLAEALAGAFFQNDVVRGVARVLSSAPQPAALPAAPGPSAPPEEQASPPVQAPPSGPFTRRLGRLALAVGSSPALAAGVLASLVWVLADQSRRLDLLTTELVVALRSQREELTQSSRRAEDLAGRLAELAAAMARPVPALPAEPASTNPPEELAAQPSAAPAVEPPVAGPAQTPDVAAAPAVPKEEPAAASGKDLAVQVAREEDGIRVLWNARPQLHATGFNIYRRRAPEDAFSGPINVKPLQSSSSDYYDPDVVPNARYQYKVVAETPPSQPPVESPPVEIESHGDFDILYLGSITAAGGAADEVWVRIRRFLEGRWVGAVFSVRPGQKIGGAAYVSAIAHDIDFSTRYTLSSIDFTKRPVYTRRIQSYRKGPDGKLALDPTTRKPILEEHDQVIEETTSRLVVEDEDRRRHVLWKGERKRGTEGVLED